MYNLATSFITVELIKLNIRLFVLFIFLLLVFVIIPPSPKNIAEEIEDFLAYYSNKPTKIQELTSLSLSVANKSRIPPELLLSILIVESYKRPIIVRDIERSILAIFIKARKFGITWLPDLSIGLPQLKLTTALWIDSGFKDTTPLSEQPTSRIKYIIKKLEHSETSVELCGLYLKRLLKMDQRLLKESRLHYNLLNIYPDLSAKVASKYQGGIPIHSTKINRYGKLVFLISKSNLVKESFKKNVRLTIDEDKFRLPVPDPSPLD